MNKLLIICGPTATGKTNLSLALAKKFNGEVVSADSRQVYRGMDIGTGKDLGKNSKSTNYKLKVLYKNKNYVLEPYDVHGILLWMYDVVDPDEEFNVAQYQKLGRGVIRDIFRRDKLPIVVGGSGLYMKVLTEDIGTLEIPPDTDLRIRFQKLPLNELQEMLRHMSPTIWRTMNVSDQKNPRRLIRKIELCMYGKTESLLDPQQTHPSYDVCSIGLTAQNQYLYRRIDERVDNRVKEGVLGEVRRLLRNKYSWELPSMSSLGYRQWKPYLEGSKLKSQSSNIEKNTLKKKIIQQWKYDEHAYARRQMTWFGKQPDILWFDIAAPGYREKVEEAVKAWYTDGYYALKG